MPNLLILPLPQANPAHSSLRMSHNITEVKERMDNAYICSAFVAVKLDAYDSIERPTDGFDEPEEMNMERRNSLENTGMLHPNEIAHQEAQKGATRQSQAAHVKSVQVQHDDDFLQKKQKLAEGIDQIRRITQKSTVELSGAMEAVIAEEIATFR